MEAQKHLEDLRKQVAEDKRRREMGNNAPTQPATQPAPMQQNPPQTVAPTKTYDECTIQIRLTNGGRIENKFKSTDTIKQLFEWVSKNRTDGSGSFLLMMTSPKKTFTPDMQDTLLAADLVPRALLILTKA